MSNVFKTHTYKRFMFSPYVQLSFIPYVSHDPQPGQGSNMEIVTGISALSKLVCKKITANATFEEKMNTTQSGSQLKPQQPFISCKRSTQRPFI